MVILVLLIGVVGLIGGILVEHARAKHGRRARAERQRRTWRREGANAIAATSDALDLVRPGAIRNRARDEQLAALLTAQREWRAPCRVLMSIAAEHSDAGVTSAAGQLRSATEDAFDAVAVATALVPAGREAREQLHHLLDAVAKNPSDVPRYAALEEVYDAWEQADKARVNAFAAMAHLSDTLYASIGDVKGRRRGLTDAPTPGEPTDRRFWESS